MQHVSKMKEEESRGKKRKRRKHQEQKEYEETPTEGPGREEAQGVSHEFGDKRKRKKRNGGNTTGKETGAQNPLNPNTLKMSLKILMKLAFLAEEEEGGDWGKGKGKGKGKGAGKGKMTPFVNVDGTTQNICWDWNE